MLSSTGKEMIETAQDRSDSTLTSILFACINKFVSELNARFAIGCSVLKSIISCSFLLTSFIGARCENVNKMRQHGEEKNKQKNKVKICEICYSYIIFEFKLKAFVF